MNRSVAIVATGLAGLLVGAVAVVAYYASVPRPATVPCHVAKHHCIKVTVDPATNIIHVDNPYLEKKTEAGHAIHWVIENGPGQSFYFPTNPLGIAFSGAGAQEFNCNIDPNDNHIYHCADNTGPGYPQPGDFKYTLTVAGGSPNPMPLDPHVLNY